MLYGNIFGNRFYYSLNYSILKYLSYVQQFIVVHVNIRLDVNFSIVRMDGDVGSLNMFPHVVSRKCMCESRTDKHVKEEET